CECECLPVVDLQRSRDGIRRILQKSGVLEGPKKMTLRLERPMKNSGSNKFKAAVDDIASTDADVRAAAMDTLAGIAAGEAAPLFRQGLRDTDERVRSHAARGLVRIGHAEALAACLGTI